MVPIIIGRFITSACYNQRFGCIWRILTTGKWPVTIGIGSIVWTTIDSSSMGVPIGYRLYDIESGFLPVVEIQIYFLSCKLLKQAPARISNP